MEKAQEILFDRLSIEIYIDNEQAKYVFKGDVDETLDVKKVPVMAGKRIIFDLGNIYSVNSCGVREWVFLMREFSQGIEFRLEKCSVSIVDQFNIVPQTMGTAEVTSFYAPYYCPNCDEEVTTLLKTKDHWAILSKKAAPDFKHSCGAMLEFDALEDCYFHQIEKFSAKKTG